MAKLAFESLEFRESKDNKEIIEVSLLKNFFFQISGRQKLVSQNITINITRGNVLNITGHVVDDGDNTKQDSTIITINNSPPSLSIVNASGIFYNKNQTINWSASDNDKDSLNFTVYFSKNCPPGSNESFRTLDHNFTTNMTSEGRYCLNVTVTDGTEIINASASWNITLDLRFPNLLMSINNTSPKRKDTVTPDSLGKQGVTGI